MEACLLVDVEHTVMAISWPFTFIFIFTFIFTFTFTAVYSQIDIELVGWYEKVLWKPMIVIIVIMIIILILIMIHLIKRQVRIFF